MFKKDGAYFIGKFEHGKAEGKGFYINDEGAYYEGNFSNNLAKDTNGRYADEKVTYTGGFLGSKFHGEGQEKGADYTFEGSYQNGKRKKGVLTWN